MISVDKRHGGADLTGSRGAGSEGQDTLLGLKSGLHQSFLSWCGCRIYHLEVRKKDRKREKKKSRDRMR